MFLSISFICYPSYPRVNTSSAWLEVLTFVIFIFASYSSLTHHELWNLTWYLPLVLPYWSHKGYIRSTVKASSPVLALSLSLSLSLSQRKHLKLPFLESPSNIFSSLPCQDLHDRTSYENMLWMFYECSFT